MKFYVTYFSPVLCYFISPGCRNQISVITDLIDRQIININRNGINRFVWQCYGTEVRRGIEAFDEMWHPTTAIVIQTQ